MPSAWVKLQICVGLLATFELLLLAAEIMDALEHYEALDQRFLLKGGRAASDLAFFFLLATFSMLLVLVIGVACRQTILTQIAACLIPFLTLLQLLSILIPAFEEGRATHFRVVHFLVLLALSATAVMADAILNVPKIIQAEFAAGQFDFDDEPTPDGSQQEPETPDDGEVHLNQIQLHESKL